MLSVTDANENSCTLAAENETQQRSAEGKQKNYLARGRIMF